ncbi:glycerophosphodiester phosphodiesterase [Aeromicrobium sp. Root495]|uniref:glycerophosphodiester phosphodiesterase family protein n=1 Tax=Aeromicrobium sp. Root495 TaxID=1736550 RepID=UPI0006F65548|nr:glycerophosphodiester phosphodiesterase family protein [Aeromicrobium sp. Root495]KQY60217.1 glycerophosphodiester phosphodiesterase [Aeromicrobium sp. Root495]
MTGSVQEGAPVLIAHRGVPGHRLEHTRPSYELAIELGTDFIEPDVVATRDGHLVVRHENEIGHTTDVAEHPEFTERRTTKVVDGVPFSGWFTEDFTLAELKRLRTRERLPQLRPQNLVLAGREPILTFAEVVQIARDANEAEIGRRVGVYVETKHPTYFHDLDLDLNDLLVAEMERLGINDDDADVPVVIQSMESANLQELRPRTPAPLVQLMDRAGAPFDFVASGDPRTYADLTTADGLEFVAAYADGIGPNKSLVIERAPDHRLTDETGLVGRAHEAGLWVHIWTMRDENNFLPLDYRVGTARSAHGDAAAEYLRFFEAGVDGVFSDFTQTAWAAREAFRAAVPAAG